MNNNIVETSVEYRGFTINLKNAFVNKKSSRKSWSVKIYDNTNEKPIKYYSQFDKYNDAVIDGKKQIDKLAEKESDE